MQRSLKGVTEDKERARLGCNNVEWEIDWLKFKDSTARRSQRERSWGTEPRSGGHRENCFSIKSLHYYVIVIDHRMLESSPAMGHV